MKCEVHFDDFHGNRDRKSMFASSTSYIFITTVYERNYLGRKAAFSHLRTKGRKKVCGGGWWLL